MRVTESKPNTCYLTAGGYLVVLKVEEYLLRTTKELSPGFTKNGRSVNELSHPYGWRFQEDGVMIGLTQEWNEKLHIIAELPFGIPELPKGYGWKGGYPVLRKPEPGEEYLSPHCDRGGHEFCYKHGHSIATGVSGETTGFGRRRLIVEALEAKPQKHGGVIEPDGLEWVDITDTHPEHLLRRDIDWGGRTQADFPIDESDGLSVKEYAMSTGYRIYCQRKDLPQTTPPKTEDKYAKYATFPVEVKTEVLMDSVEDTKFHKDNNITTVVFPAVEVREDVKPNSVFSDECICSIMNFDANFNTSKKDYTSGANPSVKGRQSRLSYFITEPLANTYKFFKPSFRYVLLYSTIAAIVYSAANFETVVGLIKSCLPKVSIEWREK